MDIYRFLPLRFYIDLLIDVLFASEIFLAFQLLIAMKLSGVSDSGKTNGEAAIPSRPVKPVAQPGVSSGDVNPIPSGLVKPVVQTSVSSGDAIPMKSKDVTAEVNSSIKPNSKTGASSGLKLGVRGRASVSSVDKGKAIVSENVGKVITFKDVTFGPHEDEVRFRLIHFWEAWNVQTKVLIGIEMLLIDEEESVIQGFIPYGRIETYLRHMKTGATYRLNKFFGSKSKPIYRIGSGSMDREFEAGSDLRGDLYDYIGHIKLVNGKVPSDGLLLDDSEIAASRRVELHVQTHDDPVLKLYLWDKVAFELCKKFKASGGTACVILVTTLNLKRFGGVLSLSSMASSRVFLDGDVQETLLYLSWLDSNLDVASRVNAEVVTKPEIATLGDLFSYMNHASATVAWFECTTTIDDVVNGYGWYYIGRGVCYTKATKGPTTLMCKKCGKSEIVGVAQYLSKLSVYDHSDQAVFVVLGDAGEELTGKKAAELVELYYEVDMKHANDSVGEDHIVSVPQAIIDTIGQTRKFIVKVSNHNLTAKTQTLTVTKVLPLEAPEPKGNLGVNVGEEADSESKDHADESVKRGADGIGSEGVKRAKCVTSSYRFECFFSLARETRESSSSFTPPLSLRISSPWLSRSVLLPFDLDVGVSVKSTIPLEKTITTAQKFHSHHSMNVSNEADIYSPALFRSSDIKLSVFLITKPLPGIVVFLFEALWFQLSPSVINRLMMTPSVTQSFGWREVILKEAISHLTGGECSGSTGFNLNGLINPFQALYRVCELNWLPGPEADLIIKNRLRLLYAVAKRNPISFGHLVYDQVIEMTRLTNSDTNLVSPNLIY
ncbi:hypothetical protein HID58_058772 [Brassica napus]|uniref:Uncharacterized protein n=1 Tax=Brassica napus TaxID=3708 RepID=A0ABQ7ZR05_BRANA|nr:hypothetical protein HID58_058772 [Brassica napus]